MTGPTLAGAAASASLAAATAASATAPLGWTAMLVLGIPLGAMAAALIGAALSYVAQPRVPDDLIPARMLGILSDALIGGWLAIALVRVTVLHRYGIDAIPVEAIAGLLAICWRGLRVWIPAKADQTITAFLDFWTRARRGGTP